MKRNLHILWTIALLCGYLLLICLLVLLQYECHHLIQFHFTRLSNGKLTVNLCKSDLGPVQATYLEHVCRVKPVNSRIGDMVSFSQP